MSTKIISIFIYSSLIMALALAECPTIKKGATGECVRYLEEKLSEF